MYLGVALILLVEVVAWVVTPLVLFFSLRG
jgi:hypothetical protein